MSSTSRLTLLGTSVFAGTVIALVHFQQKAERAVCSNILEEEGFLVLESESSPSADAGSLQAMHEGVVRDIEQQRIKRERQLDFDIQKALEEEYKKDQTVRDST